MANSTTNMPRNIASVTMKNMGTEVRREVVSSAMVMQLSRMVTIMKPLKNAVYKNGSIDKNETK